MEAVAEYVIVHDGSEFKLMFDDGTVLTLVHQRGKPCVFKTLELAECCKRDVERFY